MVLFPYRSKSASLVTRVVAWPLSSSVTVDLACSTWTAWSLTHCHASGQVDVWITSNMWRWTRTWHWATGAKCLIVSRIQFRSTLSKWTFWTASTRSTLPTAVCSGRSKEAWIQSHVPRETSNSQILPLGGSQVITWITAFCNSMKLQAMPCRATQDRQVMVESSDKMWSSVEENGKPLHCPCLENPSMKRQKMTPEDELPRTVGVQYVTGKEWKNSSRKNEVAGPKQKQHSGMDVTGDGSKVWCCKE